MRSSRQTFVWKLIARDPLGRLDRDGVPNGEFPLTSHLALATVAGTPPLKVIGDQVITTVPTGSVTNVAVNLSSDLIYVSQHGSGTVYVIDGSSNTIANTIHVEPLPWGVAVDSVSNRVYVAHYDIYATMTRKGNITVIDGSSASVLNKVTVGIDPFDVAVNQNMNRIYVSDPLARKVFVVDGSTNKVITGVSVGEVYGLGANPVTNRVYAVFSCSLAVIDGSSNTVITTFSVSCPLPSNDVAVNPNTNRVYVAARYSVEVFDGSTYAHIASINPGCNTPDTIGVNPANNLVYVDCIDNQQVSIIDGSTNIVRQTIALTYSPQDVDANAATNNAYVATTSNLAVLDPPTTSSTTTTETTSAAGTSQLTVNAQDTTGANLTGYYAVLYQSGTAVSRGYTPTAFTLNKGQEYTIEADGYGSCAFAYWMDSGDPNNQRAILIVSDTSLTAVLNCSTSA